MPWIRFTKDCETVEAVPQVFQAGEVRELSQPSCERWVRRNAAAWATDKEVGAARRDRAKVDAKAKAEAEALAKAEAEAKAKVEAEALASAEADQKLL